MKFYDFDEIKASGDCVEYARVLGLNVNRDNRCPATWRGGDGPNVALRADGWYDHVEKKGGSILDLVMAVRRCSIDEAAEELGKHYGLTPRGGIDDFQQVARALAEYVYADADWNPIHKTVRYEPKTFKQFRFEDGKWRPGLDGVQTVPYHLPEVLAAGTVYICEGEKDADTVTALGLCGTTVPMGADKWEQHYTPRFKDKHVVILRDNDDAGNAHAQRVCWELRDAAASLKIVCPSTAVKGDITDFVNAGGTKNGLLEMVEAASLVSRNTLIQPASVIVQRQESVAKRANRVPFRNYRFDEDVQENGSTKIVKVARGIRELTADIQTRFHGFPCRVGDKLFDLDRETNDIRWLNDASDLVVWMNEKSRHPVDINMRVAGAVNKNELFSGVYAAATRYELLSGVPNWPQRNDVFYYHSDLPTPTPDAGYFKQLCARFLPATEQDGLMVPVFFASPLYYRPGVKRPIWIVDATEGQGTGKTTMVELLAYLYGAGDHDSSTPFFVDHSQLSNETAIERVMRRLLSGAGRKKRIMLIDNVTGFFNSSTLASLTTQAAITGLAPYGRGEETRPNDLTYCMTVNGAHMGRDLLHRAQFVYLKKPTARRERWEEDTREFIHAHRLQIIADIIGVLTAGAQFDFVPQTRFKEWEQDVAAPILGNLEAHNAAWKCNMDRQQECDGEAEETDRIREQIREEIADLGLDPDKHCVWINSKLLIEICHRAIPGFGGHTGRATTHLLRCAHRSGILPELSDKVAKYPRRGGKRGMMWNYEIYADDVKNYRTPTVVIMTTSAPTAHGGDF